MLAIGRQLSRLKNLEEVQIPIVLTKTHELGALA